ncbi:BT_3928 family protein [Pedobacter heparinus]|uniref:DoxX family protein n=1 Tax=Pedobacter heparinus (strain ATCC 13125 / DSM 2366 / CIP 104194 / JCM 7457 / NBRC 12017 / NCIMB 9290 / NRRL B-14731 / HIM 762-3) TaxID=485917 RepID=C6XU59_PEDHD|nr:BT_3928 family protein [Pedobacter heparinus]ACU05852.1 DoxX family protein [Pedobacter heparinus DSM 2366]
MRKIAFNISKIIVGVLFIFSGLIKANDPLGFGYKLQEYFDVFHMSFLGGMATGIAILLCVLEIVLGALLLLGFWAKKVTAGLLAIIIFFTFLTFVSAAFKVVTSCGCFGDAIPLTPWQSFSKDLVLLVLIIYLFVNRNLIQPIVADPKVQQILLAVVLLASTGFGIFTYSTLPVLDFLPYKIGANIPELMKIPEGAKGDEYAIMYNMHNKKTGEKKVMSDKDYLKTEIWKDENWEITGDPDKVLVKKGYEPKIKDLQISDASGTDYTKELIENPYYNFIIVAYNLNETNDRAIAEFNALALNAAEQYNIRTVLLTSSSASDAAVFSKQMKLFAEVFYADAVPLKSMVRSNPGVLLLKNGVVINKWHYHTMPSFDKLAEKYFNK